MSRAGSQQRTLVGILERLRPHWRRDPSLPSRIDSLLSGDRRLGSRDRRLYRELIYTALRYLPWVEPLLESDPPAAVERIAWLAADSPVAVAFRVEIAGALPPCPDDLYERARILGADAAALLPAWFRPECPGAFELPLLGVLNTRAPLWIRMQTGDPGPVLREFEALGWTARASPRLAGALALPLDAAVERTEAYRLGLIEVQDVGSQLILESAGVAPGGRWLDACAGAGGKTLQLAALLGPKGSVVARDVRRAPLAELALRARRSGLAGRIEIGGRTDPEGGFDGVLVDAPCSGSGTWRRAPHLKWTTTERTVRDAAAVQLDLLRENLSRVRKGGVLVYATCSLCASENESVVSAFMEANSGAESVGGARRLLPQDHDGDGYFVASFRRT